jgi:pyruvate/2-oxoglutarate dehydrogenase complex dihydrolipoamide dehydrogenase (E3) component
MEKLETPFDFKKAIDEKEKLLESLRQQNYQNVLKSFNYVTWIDGKGVFESEHLIKVKGKEIVE